MGVIKDKFKVKADEASAEIRDLLKSMVIKLLVKLHSARSTRVCVV